MKKINIQLFAEGEELQPSEAEKVYLAKIQELEAAKEEERKAREKAEAEKKILETQIVDKRNPEQPEEPLKPSGHYAEKFLSSKEMSNKDFVENALKYREAFMKETGLDPFSDKESDPDDIQEVVEMLEEAAKQNTPLDFKHFLDKTLVDDPELVRMIQKRKKNK